ncbi:alpha/beta hydrolase [Streptomyces mexicanus]
MRVESTTSGFGPATSVRVGELTFDVATAGPQTGTPVLLLHGFPETSACWRPMAPTLTAAGLRLYAPDQRGYSPGARPEGVDAYRIEHLVADVIGLLDALGIARAHLVGHDWGAIVGWFAAAWHPDRVQTLTAVSVPHPAAFGWAVAHDADQQQRSAYIKAFRRPGTEDKLLADDCRRLRAAFGGDVDLPLVEEHLHRLSEPGALGAALSWYRAMTAEFAALDPVTVPTTYVWSDGDAYLGRAGALRCRRFVSGPYRFVELAGISHWIPEQAPHRLADEVLHRVSTP